MKQSNIFEFYGQLSDSNLVHGFCFHSKKQQQFVDHLDNHGPSNEITNKTKEHSSQVDLYQAEILKRLEEKNELSRVLRELNKLISCRYIKEMDDVHVW